MMTVEEAKVRLARLKGKPSGSVDTAELKAQVHEDLEGFAIELFKECPGGYTNVKETYYYAPELGKMSLETGAFFDTKGAMLRTKGSTDVIELWMFFKDESFPDALRNIKRWLSTSGSITARQTRKRRKLQDDEELKRMFAEAIFKDAPDVITHSASGILKRLSGDLRLSPTAKNFTALLRKWSVNHPRRDLVVIEKVIGNKRGKRSVFTLMKYGSDAELKYWRDQDQ
jgi:hypothetical protein